MKNLKRLEDSTTRDNPTRSFSKCNLCMRLIKDKTDEICASNRCGHMMHISCLKNYLFERMDYMTIPMNCQNKSCKSKVSRDTIRKALDTHEDIFKYDYSVSLYLLNKSQKSNYAIWCSECQETNCIPNSSSNCK